MLAELGGGPMSLREVFRDNVKHYRKKKNLSQEQLEEMSNLSTNYIGDIERANRKVTIDTIETKSKGLNVETQLLLMERRK